ncbi:MAG: Transmembrane exosortase (Exosortase_EpsH) [Syntrophorhabdus sp. PtaU1.Bin058]|nr:MAG: Transmembrane exosortase (Exosortase_EpsH) [Syntrophorhabdus sp. PtaU1.Bin058]
MIKVMDEIKIRPASWVKAGIYAGTIGLVYYGALSWMIGYDWTREDYSHCMLIPFVVLYLIWEKRKELAGIPSSVSWAGAIPFVFGIVLYWIGELAGEFFTLYFSLWLVIVGLLWLHLGREKIKTIGFALVMMLAMFPFPSFITARITLQLRLISSKLGVWMLHLYGMSAYREGNIIDLGFTQLQVVDACSGLRYVMPLMVLSLLAVYWYRAHIWKRAILFLSSIPLAIFVNSFRIAATGVLYSMFGAKVAEGFFHGFSGWLIFLFAIPLLFFEMRLLRKLPPREAKSEERRAESGELKAEGRVQMVESADKADMRGSENAETSANEQDDASTHQRVHSSTRLYIFIVVLVVMGLTFGLSHGIEFRQKIPIKKSFNAFPLQVGGWSGTRENMDQVYLDALKFSDYVIVNYTNDKKQVVNFYVAYYQDQRKGGSIHSPETCLPGSGWNFREAGKATVALGKGNPASMQVNRALMEKGGYRQLTYYWFPMRGRILTHLYQIKIYNFLDALTKQRTDGSLVRVITPVSQSEQLEDAEKRLRDFVCDIVPVLDGYLPER